METSVSCASLLSRRCRVHRCCRLSMLCPMLSFGVVCIVVVPSISCPSLLSLDVMSNVVVFRCHVHRCSLDVLSFVVVLSMSYPSLLSSRCCVHCCRLDVISIVAVPSMLSPMLLSSCPLHILRTLPVFPPPPPRWRHHRDSVFTLRALWSEAITFRSFLSPSAYHICFDVSSSALIISCSIKLWR